LGAASVTQFLTLYVWFPLAVLLLFLLLIARFYQRFSGERTYYQVFLLPMLCFGAATARYASLGTIAGDPLADLMLAVGGASLTVLCLFLYWLMTRNR
jgi:hypothetical protein